MLTHLIGSASSARPHRLGLSFAFMLVTLLCLFLPAAQAQNGGQVRYFPRTTYPSRMVGGLFQGSNDNSTWTTLATVTTTPSATQYSTLPTSADPQTFRYLRYLAPSGAYGNVAEVEFDAGTAASYVKLTGTAFGTAGSYNNDGFTFLNALDGSTTTYFDAPAPGNGDYVGIDRGAAVGQVRYFPRSGYPSRMVGGQFQGSTDNTNWTTFYTVTASPVPSQYTVAPIRTDPKTLRYLRYLAPPASYDDVAEIEFDSGVTTPVKVTGTGFGTAGSYNNLGNVFSNALDGNTATYFDAPAPGTGDYVGIDQGAAPVLTSIVVSPASVTLNTGGSQQFTAVAKDQNGNALSPQPTVTWSVVSGGVGMITSAGVYSAGSTAGTATVKATSGTVSGTAAVTVNAAATASIFLTVAATGANKITLYWNGIAGASGYNIYRGTVSGGPYTQIAPNVTTADNGPGMTNALMYSNVAGLTTGTEYFYIVRAVQSGTETVQSNEASDIPQTGSVPWDTGDPVQIVPSVSSIVAANLTPDEPAVGDLEVCGPDGVMYAGYTDGSAPQAFAPDAYYDSASHLFLYSDGTSVPAPIDTESPSGLPAGAIRTGIPQSILFSTQHTDPDAADAPFVGYSTSRNTGIFREVESKPGHQGMQTYLNLVPQGDATDVSLGDNYSSGDSADVYSGGYVKGLGYTIDAGLQLSSATSTGWEIYVRGSNGLKAAVIDGVREHIVNGSVTKEKAYIDPRNDEPLFSFEAPGYQNVPDKMVIVHFTGDNIVHDYTKNTNTPHPAGDISYTYFANAWTLKNQSHFVVKRVNSISQYTYDPKYHPNAPQPNSLGYIPSGSFIGNSTTGVGADWGDPFNSNSSVNDLEIFSGGQSSAWDVTQTGNAGSFPGSPQVRETEQNMFYWETNIYLQAK